MSSEARRSRTERGEGALVLEALRARRVEVAAGRSSMTVAPQVDDLARRLRRLAAGQALAHHERDGVLERRVGAVGDLLVVAAAVIAVLEHRREVAGDARPCGARRSPRRAPARPRRRRRGRPGRPARGGGARRRRGRRGASAIESAWPRRMATSCGLSLRGGSGSRALSPVSAGRSEAKATSRSGFRAMARMQPAMARFSGSVGASFLSPGLRFEIDMRED